MNNAVQAGPVVVGVGGSGRELTAIRLAAAEAGYRSVPLIAVMAYQDSPAFGAPAAKPVATLRTVADERRIAESLIADEVHAALGQDSEQVELQLVRGLPGRALVDAGRRMDAQLIVLATRHSTSTLLGSVSQFVLRHAPCPVLVVPVRAAES